MATAFEHIIGQIDPDPVDVFSPGDFSSAESTIATGLIVCVVSVVGVVLGALLVRYAEDDFGGKTCLYTCLAILPVGLLILIGGLVAEFVL